MCIEIARQNVTFDSFFVTVQSFAAIWRRGYISPPLYNIHAGTALTLQLLHNVAKNSILTADVYSENVDRAVNITRDFRLCIGNCSVKWAAHIVPHEPQNQRDTLSY